MFLMSLLLAAPTASAICVVYPTSTVYPEDGATDVPLDAQVRIYISSHYMEEMDPVLLDADGEAVPATVSIDPGWQYLLLLPDAPLEADAAYTLQVEDLLPEDTGSFEAFETSFTTGASMATVPEAPALLDVTRTKAHLLTDRFHYTVDFEVSDAPAWVELEFATDADADSSWPIRINQAELEAGSATLLDEECGRSPGKDYPWVQVVAYNLAGEPSEPSELTRGCQSVSAPASGLLALFALGVGLRRRRH